MTVSLHWPDRPVPRGVIGQSVPRIEARAKVTGGSRFAADVIPPNTLWVKIVRSTEPHARLVRVDTTAAQRVPGVRVILTAADLPATLVGQQVKDVPILAREVVRYRGDRIAAVAAEDPRIADDALALVDVEYAALPAVFDQLEAQRPESPCLHPEYASYKRPVHSTDPSLYNVQSITHFGMGDVERGFAESDVVFEGAFRTHMSHQGYIEPRCCTVDIDSDGMVHVWIADQAPYKVRMHVAEAMGAPVERVIVHSVAVGGSFGAKDDVLDAPLLYFLARATGSPVTLRWTYADELLYGTPRHPAVVILKTGVKRDGRLWARDGQVVYNGGAYGCVKPNPEGNLTGGLQLGGSYRIPHTRLESRCVYTNQVPCGYMRAPGETQVHFAVESHMDMIAHAMGIDPLEFRLLNALAEGDTTPNGLKLRDVRCRDVLERAAAASRWRLRSSSTTSDGRLRGRGIALSDRHTGTSTASTRVVLNADGSVTLQSVLADVGPGAHTVMQQIIAEELGVQIETIRLEMVSTDRLPFDLGVKGASATYASGTSAQQSARALVQVLKERAGAEWGADPSQVTWQGGEAVFGARPERRMALKDLARLNPEQPADGAYTFKTAEKPDVLSFQAQVVDVAVDAETGQVEIERLISVHDVARVINPTMHQGQLEGAIAQGIGYALMEELVLDEGQILTGSLGDYKLPTIRDLPLLETEYVQTAVGPAPFDSKGAGESGLSTVAPAIANAIFDATGIRLLDLPLLATKIAGQCKAPE